MSKVKSTLQATDNSSWVGDISKGDIDWNAIERFCHRLGNKTLQKIEAENPGIIVFPPQLDKDAQKKTIFTYNYRGNRSGIDIKTNNILGFIGSGNVECTIKSRFDSDDKQYFLQYMIQKVFAPVLMDLPSPYEQENIYDFLLIALFPTFLKRATEQGFYKEYQWNEYNDTRIKGQIDISRHVKENQPFMGNVAYKMREYSYENPTLHLIRYTIAFIEQSPYRQFLKGDLESEKIIRQLKQLTPKFSSSYSDLRRITHKLDRPINKPIFSEYEPLRKLCLRILRREGLSFSGIECNQGILIDGAWLWEEYLNTMLKDEGFEHPDNTKGRGAIHLFKDAKQPMYPDFYLESDKKPGGIVLDAKYKRLGSKGEESLRLDYYQVVTYMYSLSSKIGGLIYPSERTQEDSHFCFDDSSWGIDSSFYLKAFPIAKEMKSFESFSQEMQRNETDFKNWIKGLKE